MTTQATISWGDGIGKLFTLNWEKIPV